MFGMELKYIAHVDGGRCEVKIAIILYTVHFTSVERWWPKVIMLDSRSNGQG